MVMLMFFTVSTFTPIIISDLGFSGLNSLLLVMPAGVVIGTIELTAPFIAMKFPGWRSYLVAITVSGTLLASLLLWLLPQSATGGKLFAVYILASYGGGYAVLMSLVIANSAGYTKRSLGSSGMFVGYCIGGFTSTPARQLQLSNVLRKLHWSSCVLAERETFVHYWLDRHCENRFRPNRQ
jgi:hypothetical protein